MKTLFLVLIPILVASCEKDTTEYQQEYQPYVDEIQKRVRSISPRILQKADHLIEEHNKNTTLYSCYFCKLDDVYFTELESWLRDHPETIPLVLERAIRQPPGSNLLVFKYCIVEFFPAIHRKILEYFDVDLEKVPENQRKSAEYYGNDDIWIEFYLVGA